MKLCMLTRPAGNRVAATVTLVTACVVQIGCQQAPSSATAPNTDSEDRKAANAAPTTPSESPILETGDPGKIPAKELKGMLKGVPEALRQNQTDVQLARELGIRAWAVDFSEGPIVFW